MERVNIMIALLLSSLLWLLQVPYATGQTIKSAELQGNVTVAGMFQIYKLTNGKCEEILPSSVMALEAVKWVFKNLNNAGYLPVKIGLLSYHTCRSLQQAVENTYDILRRGNGSNEEYRRNIIGIIGPEFSSEAEIVSTITGTSKEIDRILQIGFSTTSATLSDYSKYPNFFRVVPDDRVQVQVILSLMAGLEWNRVAIVYENNTYGIQASTELKNLAGVKGICISIFQSVTVDSEQVSSSDQINTILNSILLKTSPSVRGIVFFGYEDIANKLLIAASERFSNNQVNLIFSDGIQVQESVLKTSGRVLLKSRGAFAVGSPRAIITEFEQYWHSLFQNTTLLMEEALTNPWLVNLFHQKTSCNLGTSRCLGLNDTQIKTAFPTQPLYIQYAILAAHVIARAFRDLYNETCILSSSCLKEMRSGPMIDKLTSLTVNFDKDFAWKIGSLHGRKLKFVNNVGVSGDLDPSFYEVFNFRKETANTGEFLFIKVGEYRKDGLHLNITEVRDYDVTGKETSWPNLNKANCIAGYTCEECFSKSNPDRFVYMSGNLYVIGVVPIYNKADPFGCGAIRTVNGYQIVEAMSYAVKKVNNDSSVFPGRKIGLVILNCCNNPFVITEKIIDMYKNGLNLTMGDNLDQSDTSMNNGDVLRLDNRILGFVGGLTSTISIKVSEVLQQLKFVQISYASTNTELSDRTVHPYFMRVTTPDDKQADVMIRIIKELKSEYIQVVYSKEKYGEGGRDAIKRLANEHEICIAQELAIIESADHFNYNILEELRKKAYAKIVIVFVLSHINQPLMEAISKEARKGEFMFIGSKSWGINLEILKGEARKILETSLVLSFKIPEDIDLLSYVQGINPESNRNVVWLKEYMESKLNCFYPYSFDKSMHHQCTSDDLFVNKSDFQLDLYEVFAYNSVLSLLKGAFNYFSTKCGKIGIVCPTYADNPENLIKEIKTVKLKYDGNALIDVFDENGDGKAGYEVYYIRTNPDKLQELQYFKIGEFDLGLNFEFNHKNHTFPATPSMCPNPIACSHCAHLSVTTAEPIKSSNNEAIIGLGVTVGVLVMALMSAIVIIVIIRRDTGRTEKDEFQYENDRNAGLLPTTGGGIETHPDLRRRNDANTDYLSVRENTRETVRPEIAMTTLHNGTHVRSQNTLNNRAVVGHVLFSSPTYSISNDADIIVPQPPLRSMPSFMNSTNLTYLDDDVRTNTTGIGGTSALRQVPREITETDIGINEGSNQIITDPYIHPIP